MELEEEQSTLQNDQFLLRMPNDVESVCLLDKKKSKDYVELGVDADDYYRIKDFE